MFIPSVLKKYIPMKELNKANVYVEQPSKFFFQFPETYEFLLSVEICLKLMFKEPILRAYYRPRGIQMSRLLLKNNIKQTSFLTFKLNGTSCVDEHFYFLQTNRPVQNRSTVHYKEIKK